ncbi:MAG TPA: branched-chain amino acid ABC transporter permease [Magnetospirillaceae bacterium]|jgi:branched-chain amino acid transport system permease protein
MFFELTSNAIVSGLLLGGLYAVASLGLTITFGLLEIPNVAHPTFIVLGAYCTEYLNRLGLDPVVAGVIIAPAFYLGGMALYQAYYASFERRGRSNTLQSFTFFFGVALVLQVLLILVAGVDLKSADAAYIGKSLVLGVIRMPYRLIVPFAVGLVVGLGMWLFLSRTRTGLAIRAVAHDSDALRIVGLSPTQAKRHAFGIAMMTAAVAGSALIVASPVDPFIGAQYIGRTFAVVVLAGMGSVPGTLVGALVIGLLESLIITFVGATWAPGVAFAALLACLAIRPSGIFGIAR